MAARGRACGSSESSMREDGRPGRRRRMRGRSPSPRRAVAIAGRFRSGRAGAGCRSSPKGPAAGRPWLGESGPRHGVPPRSGPAAAAASGGGAAQSALCLWRPVSAARGGPGGGRGGRAGGGPGVRASRSLPAFDPESPAAPRPQPGVVNGFSSGAFCSRFPCGRGRYRFGKFLPVTRSRTHSPLFQRLLNDF